MPFIFSRIFSTLAAPALALLALGASPAAAQEGEPRAFGDWTGVCVASHCSLSAFASAQGPLRSASGAQPAYRLSLLRRSWSSEDDLIFTPVGGSAQSGSNVRISVDGALISHLGPADGWSPLPDGAPNEIQIAPSIAQIDLLPRMRRGSQARVVFTGDDGRVREAVFSLNGLEAGANWLAAPR